MNDQQAPATQADVAAIGQDIAKLREEARKERKDDRREMASMLRDHSAAVQKMLDRQTKDIAREFRVALEQSESNLRGAKADQLAVLERDVHRLKVAVFGRADRAPHDTLGKSGE